MKISALPLRRALAGLLLGGAPFPVRADRVNPDAPDPTARLEAALTAAAEAVLATENPAGVRLLSAQLEGHRLTLNFSPELHSLGPGSLGYERWVRRVHFAAGEVLHDHFSALEFATRIDGVPLHRVLARDPTPTATRPLLSPPAAPAPTSQALAHRRIAVSPGHGYYLNPANTWVLQRGYWQGIVEDFVNHDLVTLLRDYLVEAGADVRPTRNLDRNAGNGESGYPKWQEAARYHVKALGADPSIWNSPGLVHLDQDIRTRPLYANSINAEILVSLHNNGGGGTGTETLYDTGNGFGPESKRLADTVHARLISTLRREYNPAWPDRLVKGFNGDYGENRLATRPSVLIELAFMDRPTPDNAALQDETFKRLAMRAIREGIEEYFNGPAALAPATPSTLLATTGPAGIALTWTDLASNEAGFRIERRPSAIAPWETRATVGPNVTAYTDSAVTAGATYLYRVAAYNAAGSSPLYTNEVTLGPAPAPPGSVPRTGAWLANISLRTALTAGQAVAVGVVVAGGTREVLIRGAGPSLGLLGVSAALADPRLELYRGSALVTANNDWPAALAPTMSALGAFPFMAASRDAALVQAVDGAFTVLASGPTAGAILVEGYDTGGGGNGRIVNLSARNRVAASSGPLIAGFYVAGTGARRVLLRGIGPALTALGVTGALEDPKLEIYDSAGAKLAENDDWDPALGPTFSSVGAFALPAGSRDAALVLTLAAGRSYTAQVSGVGAAAGEALVEVYELP